MVNRHDADGVAMLKFAGVGGRGFCERGARGGTRDLLLLLRNHTMTQHKENRCSYISPYSNKKLIHHEQLYM
jgi:hypothetical protein